MAEYSRVKVYLFNTYRVGQPSSDIDRNDITTEMMCFWNQTMTIREATHDDVAAIARVHVDTWRTAYRGIISDEILAALSYEKREDSWHQILNNASKTDNFTYLTESNSGRVIGFANGGLGRAEDPIYQGELNAIYVLKSCQRKGVGRDLLRVVAQRLIQMDIHSMLAWVLAENPACRFYERLGGRKVYEKEIKRGETKLTEIAYGWMDIENLQHHNAS